MSPTNNLHGKDAVNINANNTRRNSASSDESHSLPRPTCQQLDAQLDQALQNPRQETVLLTHQQAVHTYPQLDVLLDQALQNPGTSQPPHAHCLREICTRLQQALTTFEIAAFEALEDFPRVQQPLAVILTEAARILHRGILNPRSFLRQDPFDVIQVPAPPTYQEAVAQAQQPTPTSHLHPESLHLFAVMDPKVIGSLVKPPPQLRGKDDYPTWSDTIRTDMTLIDLLDLLEGREEPPVPPSPLEEGVRSNSQQAQRHAGEMRAYQEELVRYRKKKAQLFAYLYKGLHPSIQYQAAKFKEEQDAAGLWSKLKEQYSARTVADIVSLYRGVTTMRFRDADHTVETVAEYNARLRQADERLTASMGAVDARVLRAVMYLEGMEQHFPQQVAMLLRDNQHAVPGPQGLKSLDFNNVMQEMELLTSIRAPEPESGGETSKAFRAAGQRQGHSSSGGRGRGKPRGGGHHAGSSKQQTRGRSGSGSRVSKPQGQSTGSGPYCDYHKKHGHSSEECNALKQAKEVLAKSGSSSTPDILRGSGHKGKHKSGLTRVRSAKAKAAESSKRALLKLAKWIVDSGTNRVMTYTKSVFLPGSYKQLVKPEEIELADGGIIMAYGTGSVMFNSNFVVHNALYAPDLTENLIPTRIPGRKGLTFTFDWDLCDITQGRQLLATARYDEDYGLHVFQQTLPAAIEPQVTEPVPVPAAPAVHVAGQKRPHASYAEALTSQPSNPSAFRARPIEIRKVEARDLLLTWHRRLGHCSLPRMKQMAMENMVKGMPNGKILAAVGMQLKMEWDACRLGKAVQRHYSTSSPSSKPAARPLEPQEDRNPAAK
ncbi:hypothetical protein BJ508DRAFT_336778 [Ascobolus immersus RN42]|uniref:Uncharacterized protein n=1 Tax=Ascobolus immersus RN42 TaxID=1160509 RepID=A0A3N4H7E0_ASCIM|nr:hypothetical protein BJ508DRAFT_336778 [Ascobolus immersus RN42]